MERTKVSKAVAWAILASGIALSGAAYSADNASGATSASDRGVQSRGERQATRQQGDRFWASDLIGKNISLSGDRDGEIKDVIVNAQTGEVRHVVAEIDAAKSKDRLYAIPADKFQVGQDNKLTLNVDNGWLAQRKSWSEDRWPGMQDREYWSDSATPQRNAAAGAPGASGKNASASASAAPAAGGDNLHRLSKLIGQDVNDAQGKKVGEIEDAVVNLKAHKVDFVLFSHDPGVTKAEKDYAVPMAAFKFPAATADGGEGKRHVVLSMSDEKLKSLKPFEKSDRERINDARYMSRFQTQ
jgi:sporulation protein YlmC with PRC-barrel domain